MFNAETNNENTYIFFFLFTLTKMFKIIIVIYDQTDELNQEKDKKIEILKTKILEKIMKMHKVFFYTYKNGFYYQSNMQKQWY